MAPVAGRSGLEAPSMKEVTPSRNDNIVPGENMHLVVSLNAPSAREMAEYAPHPLKRLNVHHPPHSVIRKLYIINSIIQTSR